MRVLYLSYDGLTDPLGQSQILPYLIGLSKTGHQIDIISFEKPARYLRDGNNIKAICREANLGYFPLRYTKWPPVVSTIWDIQKMKRLAKKLMGRNRYHIVHCRSYIAALTGHWMQQHFNVKFLFDMRGFYADERVDGNIWPQNKPIFRKVYQFFRQKEKTFIVSADHIISLTYNAKEEILSWNLVSDPGQLSVIPCCVDTEHFNREKIDRNRVEAIRSQLDLREDQLILGYVGSTGTWYLLEDMLRYFKLVIEKFPEACMVFLTYDEPQQIEQIACKTGISPRENLRIIGVSRDVLPEYMAIFDWSVFFIKPVYSKKASSPTKQGELMSMGIPVVCNAGIGDSGEIVRKYQSGICVEDTTQPNLTAAAEAVHELLEMDRSKIRLGAKQYFSLENGIAKLNQIYAELAQ